ncbi:MAG TPA: hypothetical protein VFU93_06075 [Acidimicrobiales bacterium]|nr:hypothetical protein [Acidimicrobiales bacterium]
MPVHVSRGDVVGIAPDMSWSGYWIVSADGRVTSVGHVLDDGRVRPIPTGEVVAVAAASP